MTAQNLFMETDDRAGEFGGRMLSHAQQQRPVLHPRLPLQNADVVRVEKEHAAPIRLLP